MLEELKARVVRIAQTCDRAGLQVSTAGNFSARDPQTGLICITPGSYPYDIMKPEDIVVVDKDEKIIECKQGLKPSSDTDVHCHIYRNREETFGIVHTHAPYANVFGVIGKPILPVLGTLQGLAGGEVRVTPYLHFGTEEAQTHMIEALKDRRAVVLGGHGLTCLGRTIEMAYMVTQFVEEGARVYWMALQVGQPQRVPADVKRF